MPTERRRFLYLSPYFPPLRRVGALRPLKFARHLPDFGWSPVVLCDMWSGAPTDPELLTAIPEGTVVVREYTRGAPRASSSGRPPLLGKLLNNPEHLLLGHSVRAALRVLEQHPCQAIVVNADPFEAMLVGARVARQTGLPLVLDLRDPWSVCELRRKSRPAPLRWLIDHLERDAIETAAAVVLNTAVARDDYRAHYADLPADRFHVIRNHCDPELLAGGSEPGFERPTLLFLGNLRPFVEGDPLLGILAALAARGRSEVQLVVTGDCPFPVIQKARALGVGEMLVRGPYRPYLQSGGLLRAAHVLAFLGYRTQQRIPAKLYDYLASPRPILAVADNVELGPLLARVPRARLVGMDEPERGAEAVEELLGLPAPEAAIDPEFSSRTAARRLAEILDRVYRSRSS